MDDDGNLGNFVKVDRNENIDFNELLNWLFEALENSQRAPVDEKAVEADVYKKELEDRKQLAEKAVEVVREEARVREKVREELRKDLEKEGRLKRLIGFNRESITKKAFNEASEITKRDFEEMTDLLTDKLMRALKVYFEDLEEDREMD